MVLAFPPPQRVKVRQEELAELVANLSTDGRVVPLWFARFGRGREIGVCDGLGGGGGDGREEEVA